MPFFNWSQTVTVVKIVTSNSYKSVVFGSYLIVCASRNTHLRFRKWLIMQHCNHQIKLHRHYIHMITIIQQVTHTVNAHMNERLITQIFDSRSLECSIRIYSMQTWLCIHIYNYIYYQNEKWYLDLNLKISVEHESLIMQLINYITQRMGSSMHSQWLPVIIRSGIMVIGTVAPSERGNI